MKKRNKKALFALMIWLNLALIWGNSLMTGNDSGNLSGGIVVFLGKLIPWLGTEAGHYFVRKAAHFSEFCLLGLLTAGYVRAGGAQVRPGIAGYGLAAACIDETIQLFVPGRASSLIDVWIDSAGTMTGILLAMLWHHIRTSTQHNK